ncbi:MAG: hypothetical protein OXC14_13310 [Rhodospirillaceae bacterium]|nr:hypothetical protein [Rhodospirillaceae bacterium]
MHRLDAERARSVLCEMERGEEHLAARDERGERLPGHNSAR